MRPLLLLALACQVTLSLGYLLATPAFEGPDENDHAYYASHLAHRHALPLVRGAGSPWDEASLGHHPPLYYAVLAATLHARGEADTVPCWTDGPPGVLHWQHGFDEVAPVSDEIATLRWLRAWSVLFGAVSLLLAHRLARVVFPARPQVADVAALLLACLPQWTFQHGVLDNGNLAALLAIASLVLGASALAEGRLTVRRGAALGSTTALALITKLTSLFLLPLLGATWLWIALRGGERRRETIAAGLVGAVAIAALAGWFFARNAVLYGDPLAAAAHRAAFATNRVPEGMVWTYLVGGFLPQLGTSLVGNFGWLSLAVPPAVVRGWLALALCAAAGLALGRRGLDARRAPLVLIAGAPLLVLAQVVQFNADFFQPQGRYLFPAVASLAALTSAGLVALGDHLPAALRRLGAGLLVGGLPAAGALVLALHFAPAFRVDARGVDPRWASMVAGLATPAPAARQTLAALAPADGAQSSDPLVFRWQPEPGAPHARYTLHVFTARGRVLFGSFEWGRLAFATGEFALRPEHWQMLPVGEELWWKVRRLPDRARGEGVDDVPETAPRRFTRSR